MQVQVLFTCNDELRKALNFFHGKSGLASRSEMKSWFYQYGHSRDIELLGKFRENGKS